MKIAIVVASFNSNITTPLCENTKKRLIELGVKESEIHVIHVPGAVELPFGAAQLEKKKIYNAIICIGVVIKGETDHYEYVCEMVSNGHMQLTLSCSTPIIFGVLTTQNMQLAQNRVDGTHSNKGQEWADAAIQMCELFSVEKNATL